MAGLIVAVILVPCALFIVLAGIDSLFSRGEEISEYEILSYEERRKNR